MKKTYINPVTVVINIQTQQMIAESAGFSPTSLNGSLATSRYNRSLWDSEDDYDEE